MSVTNSPLILNFLENYVANVTSHKFIKIGKAARLWGFEHMFL